MASTRDELVQIAAAIYGDVEVGRGETRAGISISEALEIMAHADEALAKIRGQEFVNLDHYRVRGPGAENLSLALEAAGIGVKTDLTMTNRPPAISVQRKDHEKAMKIVDNLGLHRA